MRSVTVAPPRATRSASRRSPATPRCGSSSASPKASKGPRFVPPTSFAGRLVPFKHSGVRHVRLIKTVHDQTDVTVPDDAWLIIDGGSPRASRWAVALALLFLGFTAWNVASVARVLARGPRSRDRRRRARSRGVIRAVEQALK